MNANTSLITDIEQQKTVFYLYDIKGNAEDIDYCLKFNFLLSSPGFGTIFYILSHPWGITAKVGSPYFFM